MSILDIAAEIVGKVVLESIDDLSRTVVIVGSKSVGKSTLLHAFLDKNETVRETLVLDYSFGRKSSQRQGLEKSICHVWEYGGRLEMLGTILSSIPSNGKLFYCIMLDLSKVKSIWNVLELCIQALKEVYKDMSVLDLIIIGGKYDLFKNYDSELKKIVCSTLRAVALIFNAHLFFYSSKDNHLLRKAKDILHIVGFGAGDPVKDKYTNHTKPLFIPKGTDSWEHIGISTSTIDEIKIRYLSRVGSESKIKQEIKPLQRTHPEPILDSLAALKYEELRSIETFDSAIDEYLTYMHNT